MIIMSSSPEIHDRLLGSAVALLFHELCSRPCDVRVIIHKHLTILVLELAHVHVLRCLCAIIVLGFPARERYPLRTSPCAWRNVVVPDHHRSVQPRPWYLLPTGPSKLIHCRYHLQCPCRAIPVLGRPSWAQPWLSLLAPPRTWPGSPEAHEDTGNCLLFLHEPVLANT